MRRAFWLTAVLWCLSGSWDVSAQFIRRVPATGDDCESNCLYVNNSGSPACSDSTAKASNSAASPWCTIGRAVWGNAARASASSGEAAAAGDTVVVTAGIYSMVGNGNKYDATLTPMNSGSSGNPITIQCATAGACDLRHSSGTGAIAGACGSCPFGAADYITWDGFLIDDNNVTSEPDTGPFVFVNCTGCVLKNSTIKGEIGLPLSDNYDCVRIDSSFDIFIQNNTIQDCSGIPSQHGRNHAGIQTYYSSRLTIEHNTVTNCGSGIFIKGMSESALPGYQWQKIRFNLVYANETAGILFHLSPGSSTYPANVYQNIVRDNGQAGVRIQALNGGTFDSRSLQIVNNTIVDNFIGFHILNAMVTNAGHAFWNNIVKGGSYCINAEGTADLAASKITSEHNIGHGCSDWAEVNGTSRTLSAWQSTYTQDDAAPDSQFADPLFTNYAGNIFTLQGGSPALSGCGVDMLDLDGDSSTSDAVTCGAYITGSETIGPQ